MSDTMKLPVSPKDLLIEMKGLLDKDQNALTPALVHFYNNRYLVMKDNIDELAAEVHQRQDKMRVVNDLICDINNLTDANNSLDFSKNPEIQEKLELAKALGANINVELKYGPIERDRLIQNLHIKADEWDKDNRTHVQKLESYTKELDRILMMIKEVQKSEDRAKRASATGIKGG